MTQAELVTLCVFSNPQEAHIAKGKLESMGFECQLLDEQSSTINQAHIAIGLRLQVRQQDLEKAKAALV